MKIVPITEPVQHAEGPTWSPKSKSLLFVDTFQKTVYRWDYSKKSIVSHKLEHNRYIGVIIPIKDTIDRYIIGADRELYQFHWPISKDTPALNELVQVDQSKPNNHFNDGKADSMGRLWLGTLTRNEDLTVPQSGGSLFMFSGKNLTTVEEKIADTSISNGLAWSLDDSKFYFIDSHTRTIVAYDYDSESAKITNQKTIFDLSDHSDLKGIADGMTIDSQGNLWVALFGGKSIICINPTSRELLRKVEMPTTYVTSACFGGAKLDVLYVTTSRLHLSEEELKGEPSAGCVFAIEGLGVSGVLGHEAVV